MTESVEAPERIWIESEGECPYFYHEDELSDVAPPITEYVRADKLLAERDALAAENARLREALEGMEQKAWSRRHETLPHLQPDKTSRRIQRREDAVRNMFGDDTCDT